MNRKGFTLVELIAMMAILAILMAITVPNISGILKNNKESIQVEDINKMIETAKQKFKNNEISYPKTNSACAVLTLSSINTNDDFTTGVNGGTYLEDASYIVVKRVDSGSTYEYKYYVKLVERKANKSYAMGPVDYDTFTENPKKHSSIRVKDEDVVKLTDTGVSVKDEVNRAYKEKNGGTDDLCSEVTSMSK